MSERAPDVKGGPLAQRAAILCGEIAFRAFLFEQKKIRAVTEVAAARAVRRLCGAGWGGPDPRPLRSRAELDHIPEAAARWRQLEADYRAWRRR